jgi:hypothetical protein
MPAGGDDPDRRGDPERQEVREFSPELMLLDTPSLVWCEPPEVQVRSMW